jgi:hypothetical protein
MAKGDIPDWVRVGALFRSHNDLWHVRGIVDGNVVARRWQASKQRWQYVVLEPEWFIVRPELTEAVGMKAGDKMTVGPEDDKGDIVKHGDDLIVIRGRSAPRDDKGNG